MKNLSALILIAALAVSLVACGNAQNTAVDPASTEMSAENAAVRSSFDKADAYITSLLDTKDMETSVQDDDGGKDIYKTWSYNEQQENVPIDLSVEVDGHSIELGKTTGKGVKGFGLDYDEVSDPVKPGETVVLTLYKDDTFSNITLETNNTADPQPVDSLTVSEVTTNSLPFTYGKLTGDSTLKDVVDALGTPNSWVNLSADSIGTSIELTYSNEEKDGSNTVSNVLVIYLIYDADEDTAAVSSLTIRTETFSG